MEARRLNAKDVIPFQHGLEPLPLDCHWAWVAVDGDKVTALLLAAPCHGSVFLFRLIAADDAPKTWALRLMRQAARDMIAEGYHVCWTMFNLERDVEARLLDFFGKVCKSGKMQMLASRHAMCAMPLEDWSKL